MVPGRVKGVSVLRVNGKWVNVKGPRQYLKAVHWIAANDDAAERWVSEIEMYLSVKLVADVWGKSSRYVARHVQEIRLAMVEDGTVVRMGHGVMIEYRAEVGKWEVKDGGAFVGHFADEMAARAVAAGLSRERADREAEAQCYGGR